MFKRVSIWLLLSFAFNAPANGQGVLKVSSGTFLSISEGTSVNLHEVDMVNNGDIKGETSSIFLTAAESPLEVRGRTFQIGNLHLNTPLGTSLQASIQIENELILRNGVLNIRESDLFLGDSPGQIVGENGDQRITGTSGVIKKSVTINSSDWVNPGNIGLEISSLSALGLTEVIRGHSPQKLPTGTSISRYYKIFPEKPAITGIDLRFNYFEEEQNAQYNHQVWKQNRTLWLSVPTEDRSETESLPDRWLLVSDFELADQYTVGPEENTNESLASIPTAFTPNGDGRNDTFIIPWIQHFPNAVVTIFDQWGGKVYEKTAYHMNAWDGHYRGDLLPSGSFYYVINFQGSRSPVSGKVSIIR